MRTVQSRVETNIRMEMKISEKSRDEMAKRSLQEKNKHAHVNIKYRLLYYR